MALKALDIFKLTPKKNCKECVDFQLVWLSL